MLLRKYHVAVVGAAGLVGQEFLKVLEQTDFPSASIHLLASDRSVGKKLFVNHRELEIKELSPRSFDPVDIAFFTTGAEVSKQYVPLAMKRGAVVIDSSLAFQSDPEVPLIIPEVNPEDMANHRGLVANPSCTTIQLAVALFPLHKVNPIRRMVVTMMQSVSGTGATAVEELSVQSKAVLEGRSVTPHIYPHQIAFNLLPEVDVFLDNGYTREEWRTVEETQRVFHDEDMAVSVTSVRVPVYVGHSAVVQVELNSPMNVEDARKILNASPGIKVLDDPAVSLYPHPWAVAGANNVFVGRIRRDSSHANGLAMWVVADNVRKGAALNAVQIAAVMAAKGWL